MVRRTFLRWIAAESAMKVTRIYVQRAFRVAVGAIKLSFDLCYEVGLCGHENHLRNTNGYMKFPCKLTLLSGSKQCLTWHLIIMWR
jgi:hypothetical protein